MKISAKDFNLEDIETANKYYMTANEIEIKFPVGAIIELKHKIFNSRIEIGEEGIVAGYFKNFETSETFGDLYLDVRWNRPHLYTNGGYYPAMFERVIY